MTHRDTTLELTRQLPDVYPSAVGTGNYKLLEPVGKQLEKNDRDITEADFASTVADQMAPDRTLAVGEYDEIPEGSVEYYNSLTVDGELVVRGTVVVSTITVSGDITLDGGNLDITDDYIVDRLKELGRLLDLPPNEGETAEHYRARLIIEFSLLSNEATIADVLQITGEVFDISPSRIDYEEPAGSEHGTIQLSLPSKAIENKDFTDSEVSEIIDRIIPASYRSVILSLGSFTYITPEDYNLGNHDSTLGYDGLDANGDPKDNGGTYAGTI